MVWSDQSQFPFYVIDNNGNVILTIDETGFHLVGTTGRIDLKLNAGQPTIQFSSLDGTAVSFINAPIFGAFANIGINSGSWVSTLPGNPTLKDLIFLQNNFLQIGTVKTSDLTRIGGQLDINDKQARFFYADETGAVLGQIIVNANGVYFGKSTDTNQLQYNRSDGYLRLSSTVNPAADWTNLTMKNGWTAAAGGWQTPQARVNPLGAVEFRGFAQAGARADGTVMFSLPYNSLRPTTLQIMAVGVRPTGAGVGNSSCLFNDGTNADFQVYGINDGVTDGVILTGLSYYP